MKSDTCSLKDLDLAKHSQFDLRLNNAMLPTQMFLVKLAKNNAWSAIKKTFDKDLNAVFEVVINSDVTKVRKLSYSQICKSCGWKSFKLSENGQYVLCKSK